MQFVRLFTLAVALLPLAFARPLGAETRGTETEQRGVSALRPPEWRAYRERLQQTVDAVVAAGVPGMVAYVRDGARTLTVTSGLRKACRETVCDIPGSARPPAGHRAMRKQSRFRVASLSKAFVAAALLQLEAEGALDLDDAVELWLPGLVPNGGAITIRQLLSHTSGLAEYVFDAPFYGQGLDHFEPEDLVAVGVAKPPLFEPGTGWSYSNTGYVLAGLVLEAVTGRSAGGVLQERIFEPLRLRRIGFEEDPIIPGKFAHGYWSFPGGEPPFVVEVGSWHDGFVGGYDPSYVWAAGNIAADAGTIARFYSGLLGGRVLPDAQLQEMKSLVPIPPGSEPLGGEDWIGYGLGIYQSSLGECDQPWWGHTGWLAGYLSIAANSEDASRQVVMMVNADGLFFFHEGPLYDAFDAAWCGLFPRRSRQVVAAEE